MFEKIMVVEDDADFRMLLVDELLKGHYEIVQAEDGEQAIDKFNKHKPRLILLDLLLPKMDGFTVLEKLKEITSIVQTPIIIYTNFDKPEYAKKAKEFNIEDYYLKSQTQINTVCQRVKELLEAK